MKKALIVSYGNISTSTPLFKYIVKYFSNHFNNSILIHTNILSYDDFSNSIEIKNLHKFKDHDDYFNQTLIIKIKRFIKLSFLLITYLRKRETKTVYTCDIEVVVLLRIISFILNFRSSTVLIYHQFEMIEIANYKAIKRYFIISALKFFQYFDLIILPEINRINFFIKQTGVDRTRILLFPNTCTSNIIEDKSDPIFLNKIIDDDIVIGHIGNVNKENFYLKELLDLYNNLDLSHCKLLFAGKLKDETKAFINGYQNDNIILNDYLHHKELKSIYLRINIGLILYKPRKLNEEYCAPNKLYEYLSFGIPVLAPRIAGLTQLIENKMIVRIIDFNDRVEFRNSIMDLTQNKSDIKKEIIKTFQEGYDVSIYLESLNKILIKLVERKYI